jgi:hypothetical protein
MYELHVADKNGKVQQWWINFLTAAFGGDYVTDKNGKVQQWWINFLTAAFGGDSFIFDIEVSLKEWNADSVIKNNLVDKIIFQNEGDLIWFLLHWS